LTKSKIRGINYCITKEEEGMKNKFHYGLFALVAAGWFLNAKYYYSRFNAEGFPWELALTIAVSLVVFASVVFVMRQRMAQKKPMLALWALLAIYSINCTVAGQYWDQQVKNTEVKKDLNSQENSQYLIESWRQRIIDLDEEYKTLEAQKRETIKNLEDRFDYKRTTADVEKRQDEIKKERKEYEQKIEAAISGDEVSAKSESLNFAKNIYQFYSADRADVIQFIFQVFLSVIIELIAPLSLLFFTILNKKPCPVTIIKEEKTVKEEKPKEILNKSIVRNFVTTAWYMIRANKKDYLTNKDSILKMANMKRINFSPEAYDKIIECGLANNLISLEGGRYKPASNFVDEDYFYEKICEYLKL
jgi:hypothetical protein